MSRRPLFVREVGQLNITTEFSWMKHHFTFAIVVFLAAPTLFAQVAPEIKCSDGDIYDPDDTFTIVEVMPEFPGGGEARVSYIDKELKYPAHAIEAGIQGVVYITFMVERDGSINDVQVLRGIGGGCDEEAVRVVKGMPNWKPGTQGGKPVRVMYNLPLRYHLD